MADDEKTLAFTIGDTDSYEQAIAEKREAGEALWKVGRFKPDGKPVTYDDGETIYPGGIVFKTDMEARSYLFSPEWLAAFPDENPKTYSVYEIELDEPWGQIVDESHEHGPYSYLLRRAKVVRRVPPPILHVRAANYQLPEPLGPHTREKFTLEMPRDAAIQNFACMFLHGERRHVRVSYIYPDGDAPLVPHHFTLCGWAMFDSPGREVPHVKMDPVEGMPAELAERVAKLKLPRLYTQGLIYLA